MITTIIFTLLSAWYDNGKRFINHIPRFIFRAVTVLLISYLTGTSFLLNTAIFYAIFDYALNLFEGRNIFYIGQTAIIDQIWQKLGGWLPQLVFKVFFVCLWL